MSGAPAGAIVGVGPKIGGGGAMACGACVHVDTSELLRDLTCACTDCCVSTHIVAGCATTAAARDNVETSQILRDSTIFAFPTSLVSFSLMAC